MNRNALHLAAMEVAFGSAVIKLLIESGVDVTCKDKVKRLHFFINYLIYILLNSGR